jgi:hypothetical protein
MFHLGNAQELWDYPDLIYDDVIYEVFTEYKDHFLYTVIIPILKLFVE